MIDGSTQLLDPAMGTPAAAGITVGVVAVWMIAHRFKGLVSAWPLRAFFFACRTCLFAVATWLVASLAARHFTLGFVLPLSAIAMLGAIVVESVIALTGAERRMLGARGKWLLWVRIAAILWLVAALLEPLSVNSTTRHWQREVAVIVDDSGSMQIVDEHAGPGYTLEVAALFGDGATKGRPMLHQIANSLRGVLDSLRRSANGFFDEALLDRVADKIQALPGELDSFDPELRRLVLAELGSIRAAQREGDAPGIDRAEGSIGSSIAGALAEIGDAQQAAEAKFLSGLSEQQRSDIASSSRHTRAQIAREALTLARSKSGENLISRLQGEYKVRLRS
jgi:hypothetical protein